MSATVIEESRPQPRIHLLADPRPPAFVWARSSNAASTLRGSVEQPPLLFEPEGAGGLGPPRPSGHHVLFVDEIGESVAGSAAGAGAWSAALALAIAETLQGRRPVGQLCRWVDEQVLASLTVTLRRQPRSAGATLPPARLRSVRLQSPREGVVEAAAHVQLAARSTAFAFRLETCYDRWLCTALDLGPAHPRL